MTDICLILDMHVISYRNRRPDRSSGIDAQTRTGTLYADLPTPEPLKPGVYVEGRIVTGSSADTDTIVASTKAYINALNRLIIRRQKTAPGEDVKTVSYHGE